MLKEFHKEFPKNSQRIPKEFLKNSDRIPKEFPMNSQRIPKDFLKNSQRINSQRKIPKNSQDFENIPFPTSHLEAENPFGLVFYKSSPKVKATAKDGMIACL